MPTETELKLAIEGAHQMRAATRRMRSCLQLYRTLIPKTVSSAINNGIRRAADALGPTRDRDVFIEETLQALGQALCPPMSACYDTLGVAAWRDGHCAGKGNHR